VTSDVLPAPQIGDGLSNGPGDTKGSGVVWDQLVVDDTVYVGGKFDYARPAGAGPGESVVSRKNFLAYNVKTGELLDLAIPFNQQIRTFAVSRDGKRLYVGGSFTEVAGQTRYRLAAIDIATGAIVSDFVPEVDASVNTIAVSNTRVYIGGVFSTVQNTAGYTSAAALRFDGSLDKAWQPNPAADQRATFVDEGEPSDDVLALLVSPDDSKVIIGGNFNSLNGSNPADASQPGNGMGAVRADTGDSLPWAVNKVIRGGTTHNAINSLATDGEFVYGSGYWNGSSHGKVGLEGSFKASWDGTLQWMEDCHGDTYSVYPHGDSVYKASHAHNCETSGSFTENQPTESTRHHRALALSTERKGTLTKTTAGAYGDFSGQPAPEILHWYPDLSAGEFTGSFQAAWDVTAAGDYVLFAGEFPAVNGVKQQGLARFGTKAVAPRKDKPEKENADMVPTIAGVQGTYVRLSWLANYDRDNEALTYQVIRDEDMANPVFTKVVSSSFYNRPTIRATDGYLVPGSTHTYRIRTVDPDGNARWGNPVSYTVPAGDAVDGQRTVYDSTVLADQPTAYWPMNETGGVTAFDWVDGNNVSVLKNRDVGAEAGISSTARSYWLGGATWAATNAAEPVSKTFSTELWFKTNSRAGGQLVGMSTKRDLASPFDRQLYMDTEGRVSFASTDGTVKALTTTGAFNDGKWHHVVATVGSNGATLYMDGTQRLARADLTAAGMLGGKAFVSFGAHDTPAVRYAPPQRFYAGSLDNVALYDRVLSASDVAAHYAAGTKKNVAPRVAFTPQSSGLSVTVDGSASSDIDGTIASFAWSFGDGSTATGETAAHDYAKAGTYAVTLTVEDNVGAVSTSTTAVTVSVPDTSVLAHDRFERSTANGWGSAEVGGAWKAGSGSTLSTADGVGALSSVKGQTSSASLIGATSDTSDTTVAFRLDGSATGGGQFVSVTGRQVGSDSYAARVWVQSSGALQLQLMRSGTTLSVMNLADVAYAAGTTVHMRVQVSGLGATTLSAKAWTTGAEPAAWTRTIQDTTAALQAPGAVGLGLYVSSTATAPSSVSFDNYVVEKVAL
jgi:PKD repeat protein